jgi:hypothetical protein
MLGREREFMLVGCRHDASTKHEQALSMADLERHIDLERQTEEEVCRRRRIGRGTNERHRVLAF